MKGKVINTESVETAEMSIKIIEEEMIRAKRIARL